MAEIGDLVASRQKETAPVCVGVAEDAVAVAFFALHEAFEPASTTQTCVLMALI